MPRRTLPGPRPVLRNPEQDAIVRLLTRYGPALPASELFARVERAVPSSRSDYAALATEALRLERRGLVLHRLENQWRLMIELTARGRRLVRLRHLDEEIKPKLVGVTMMAPVLASGCSWTKPTAAPAQPTTQSLPVRVERPVARLEQFYVAGQVEWLWCSPPHCPVPTPKKPAAGGGSLPPIALSPIAATMPEPAPSQAAASLNDAPQSPSVTAMPGPATALPADLTERIARATRSQASGEQPSKTSSPPAAPARARSNASAPVRQVSMNTSAANQERARRELHTAFFDFASADLRGEELAFAKRVAVAARHGARVTIVGMTDRSGDAAKNERLAQRRADAMLLLLAQAGLDPDNVTVQVDTTGSRTVPPQTLPRTLRSDGDARFRRVDVLITYGSDAGERPDRSASTTLFGVPSPYEIASMRALAPGLLPQP